MILLNKNKLNMTLNDDLIAGFYPITSRILGTHCGRITEPLPAIVSTGNMMRLKFTSDSSVTADGFRGYFVTSKCVM